MNHRSYHKYELARLAGVSYATFYRFLYSRRAQLTALGCAVKSHTLRGAALRYVCEEYCIELPDTDDAPPKHQKFR